VHHVNRKPDGGSALHEAVAHKHEAVVELLLRHRANPFVENCKVGLGGGGGGPGAPGRGAPPPPPRAHGAGGSAPPRTPGCSSDRARSSRLA
jgi:ankyrin repeat protein